MSTRSQLTKDLNDSVKALLGRHTKILIKYMVKLETKGDKTDNRVLVFTPVRIYLLIAKVPTKIDCHFHYLDIQSVESKDSTHFTIITNDRAYSFVTSGDAGNFSSDADVIVTDLASAIKQIFPTVPLKYIIRKIDIQPSEREAIFSDELRPSDPRNVGPCGGFSRQYACMCDFHGITYRDEVAWDIDTIYLSHDTRILNLRDFDHLEPKDLTAIVSALEYNTFFRGLKVTHTRLSHETLERILHVLRRSMWLEELHLEALGLRSDFVHKLAVSVITNNSPALRTIDLSHNLIEDKGSTSICALIGKLVQGAVHLAGPIAKISKGLCRLSLSHCGLTAKGVNQMAHSLTLNQSISSSLTYLDLSGNNLKDDINNLYNFLAQPNVLEYLDLSATDTFLENLFGALLRGCSTHLTHLNVSHNFFNTKKGKEIPPSFKQFFTSSLSLKHLNIASCKLPLEALKHLLLGLACNESTAGLHLDLSSNSLGAQGAHVLESCIHGVRVLQSLDIGDNNLDSELASVLTAIGKNPSIKSLNMTRSFAGMKLKHIATVMDALVGLIQKDDFPLTELILAENKLKNDIHDFINALGSNQSLQKLDISGNLMGDIGARLLAKALQINNKLRSISFDRNNITLQGYNDIVYALENNFSMRNILFPVFDIAPCLKQHPERTDFVMRKMQEYLQRNSNGFKHASGQGFRLQHGFLLSSTHQLVDKLVSETQETISFRHGGQNVDSAVQRLIDDAENSKQLLPKLQESVRCDQHPIEVKLSRMANDLSQNIRSYLTETMETMLRTGVEQCPKTLGNQSVLNDLRKNCQERLHITDEFLHTCIMNNAGGEIMNKISEVEQSLAGTIADRASDEVIEALTRCRRGLDISDSQTVTFENAETPDIVRSRSSQDSMGFIQIRDLDLPHRNLDSPTATPHFQPKRRSFAHKVRPQSVVENLSVGHIPDLLETPNSRNNSSGSQNKDNGENCDSITELPSTSLQLQHLVKGRPKRVKTRAPTRPLVTEMSAHAIGEGIEAFFRPGSVTPTTLTPLVSPTSDECSSLSFVDSPTMSRDDHNGKNCFTSEETTPILEERKPIKLERNSPLLKGVASWTPRSRSTDNLEKYSPLVGRKSPLIKKQMTEVNSSNNDNYASNAQYNNNDTNNQSRLLPPAHANETKTRSPSNESIKSFDMDNNIANKVGNGVVKTPLLPPKPRPWSVAGNEGKCDFTVDSSTTPDGLDGSDVVLIEGQSGGSIVGITPAALSSSIVGISPGAALEKKSVRDMAAGLNRLGDIIKPKPLPRNVINFTQANSSNNSSTVNNSNENTTSTTANTTPATATTVAAATETTPANTPAKSASTNPAMPVVTSTVSKTESLIQRFSFNSSSKSTPDVMKRISSKQIATIFESNINGTKRDVKPIPENVS
ncbi:F-actin-uncapping protein LRRC16A isoform X4 [Sitodiplosis mosellana]|uniref:F-actin-uncapping protein LRRC16A isoform X4 n=1 Tax=Sitodiplosis mosellana TaxID=263140 RepID=UPI002444261F|nr:F-actin-uncapping protein LRRC16A isoform X4 [Sitodiplosis mosellana]